MPRIRTIKPEFPQSESMGRVSREARLLFILIWTFVDDAGRCRGASKLLASNLFPYDDDAPSLIDGWINELEREHCIGRYEVNGSTYLEVLAWGTHQKIEKPTPSRLPSSDGAFDDVVRERDIEILLYNALERSRALFGENLIDVRRQVRVGSRYADIVAKSTTQTFVLELKKTPLAIGDLRQLMDYCGSVEGSRPVLVGPSISPRLSIDECRKHGIAILLFDQDFTVNLALQSEFARECSLTLAPRARAQDLGPRTMDLGPRKEKIAPSRKSASGGATPLPADWSPDLDYAEKLGLVNGEAILESRKFMAYWTQGKGSGKRRTPKGWRQSWFNWVNKAINNPRNTGNGRNTEGPATGLMRAAMGAVEDRQRQRESESGGTPVVPLLGRH